MRDGILTLNISKLQKAFFCAVLRVFTFIAILGLASGSIAAPVIDEQESSSAVLQADDFSYDQEKKIFIATGNVVLEQQKQIVTADKMTYDQPNDLVIAEGHVVFTDKTGQTYFADKVRLEQGLKSGVVEQVGIRFPDGARLAGRQGVQENENKMVLRDGLYSPCNLCVENPKKAPMWRLNADKVVHDKEAQDIYYHNVTLDAYGIPVGYMPYFSHPFHTQK